MARLGVTANMVTLGGALLHVPVLWLLAAGQLRPAGSLLAVASVLDGVDGALARATGRDSARGAFLDSTLDRVAEIMVWSGLLVYFQSQSQPEWVIVALLGLSGSLMVSYTRARAEGAGIGSPRGGMFSRLERLAVIVGGLLLAGKWMQLALGVVTVGAWMTAAQRVWWVWRRTR
jgi:CDP-diacylglycerol--glycerol-3-phosphate 3-phosphatidyltransferase